MGDYYFFLLGIPTLFQYNPAGSFIEEINEEIVLTTKNATPLVRYNIHDKGGIIKFREMEEILKKYGYDYKKLIKKYLCFCSMVQVYRT